MEQLLEAPYTLMLLILIGLISYQAFNDTSVKAKLIFRPYIMNNSSEWHRILTSGFIHADGIHLGFNLFVLYSFGTIIEGVFVAHFGLIGGLLYTLLFLLGVIAASLPDFVMHRNNPGYSALGASGGVSAVVFASILFFPLSQLHLIFIPFIPIYSVIFGIIYLAYSQYAAKNARDNIGHAAHFYGAIFGFLFPIALDYHFFISFVYQIRTFLGV